MLKKVLSVLLVCTLVLGTMSTVVFAEDVNVAKIGDVEYPTLEAALAKVGSGDVVIEMLDDAVLNVSDAYIKLGTKETTSITINGNEHRLDLTTTYWSRLNMANENAKLILNNMTVDSSQESGTWNSYDITFLCPVELNNVDFEKAVALENDAKLKKVSITEAHDYYALWVSANGSKVEIDELTINSKGRGIKIDDEYCKENTAKVDFSIMNSDINTKKKAAIMVKTSAGAEITADNVDITNVEADSINLVWVDEDAAEYQNLVIVKGALKSLEGQVAKIGDVAYTDLQAAVDAAKADDEITLIDDVVGKGVVIDKNITIDFNGKTYSLNEGVGSTGTESNGLQILKDNTVTIKNGTLEVAEGSEDKFYILVQNYANLTVEDMTLDGTGLDKYSKSTNPADGDSYTLSVNCGTVEIKGETNIKQNNDGDKAVAISADKFSTYTEPNVTINTTGFIEGKVTDTLSDIENGGSLVIKGGYFTENPSAYLAEGKVAKYDLEKDAYYVEDVKAEGAVDVTTDVADCTSNANAKEGSDITEEQLAEITTAITDNTDTLEKLEKVAGNMQHDEDVVGTTAAATQALEKAGVDIPQENATVTVVIQPYLDIVVNNIDSEACTIELEIEPMYNVVATTATGDDEIVTENGEGKNAVVLKEAQPLEITAPMTITVGLPSGFANDGDTVYIHHTKDNGTTYVYEATVTVADDKTTATFTNPNGFSKFEVKKNDSGKAEIDGTVYATLADAVANVKDGETITLLADVDEDEVVTVTEIMSFVIDAGVYDFDAKDNIKAGDNRKVSYTETDDKYTFTVKKKTTPPTTQGSNGPSWNDNSGVREDNSYVPSKPQQSVVDKTFKFTDVADDFWGYDGIYYCYNNGIMNGMGGSLFEPNTTMTRAMLVTMLYRLEGSPNVETTGSEWYSKAQAWAMETAVSDGTNMTDQITREQLATMLSRYASKQGIDTGISADLAEFADNADISEYAYNAVSWAVRSGLINGMGDGTISPKSGATRAQVATIFMRAADIIK